jgi:dihydroorotate dehydrogenase electron transfer subunit
MAKVILAKLLKKEQLAHNIYKFSIEAKEIASQVKPGQFIEIKVSENIEPFLRRPISIHNVDKENGILEIIFRAQGKRNGYFVKKTRRRIDRYNRTFGVRDF